MRSLIVILATITIVASGYTLYSWMQPARSARARPDARVDTTTSSAAPATNPANQSLPISKGEKVFIESFDNKTGNLSRRFRGATWDPQPDGTVKVEQPEAEFFTTDGQVIRVRGERGEVVVPTSGSRDAMSRAQLPTRGKIYKVEMSLTPAGGKRPALVCTVNNLSFDNDTFLLATEEFKDEAGNVVPADQVPVTIRGDEYDFDGKGLITHYDERAQRLHMLEIAHGGNVIAKNPNQLGLSRREETASPPAERKKTSEPPREKKPAATAPATQPDLSPPYRATFVGDVRIEQGGQQLAQCDQMNIDFLMGSREEDAPREAPSTPSTRPSRTAATRSQDKTPAEQPIKVLWTGKLTIQPAPIGTSPPKGKDTIVEMVGVDQPVIAKSEDGELRCASFRFDTNDNSLTVRNSAAVPVVTVKDATGVSIDTSSFDYSGEHRVAIVKGKSQAQFPIGEDKPGQLARVDWSESCTLRMSAAKGGARGAKMAIEHAALRGDVKIDHPQMTLASRELDLAFDPTNQQSRSAKIRQMTARDEVRGRFADPNDASAKPQAIDADSLVVDFESGKDGRSFTRKAVASGSVRAGDGKSELRANHLEVMMSPAPNATPATKQPAGERLAAVQLESLFAQQGVRATSTDGQEIQCEQLHMTQTPDGPRYTLQGEVSAPAKASDGTNWLVGPIIKFDPSAQHAQVTGAGSMRGTQQVTTGTGAPTTQPLEVTWQNGLDADGKKNLITIDGNVVAKSTLEDGSTAEVIGKQMLIALADAPATNPAKVEAPMKKERPGGIAFGGAGADMNAFRNKVFKEATIDSAPEQSEVRSTLLAGDGSLLRRLHLFATKFQYEPESKRMIVPVAGRMLYEDRRGGETKPAEPKPGEAPVATKLNLRGATAFEWKKDFIYDDATRQATMSGEVDVVHRGANASDSYRLHAQRLVAELMPGSGAAQSDEMKLKRLTADGGVTFNSAKIQFVADRVEYDPQRQILFAFGTDRAPATLLDDSGSTQGTFTRLEYDLANDRLKMTDPRGTVNRSSGPLTGANSNSDK